MSENLISSTTQINSLLEGLQRQDPKLYQLLRLMNKDLGTIFVELHPIKTIIDRQQEALTTTPKGITDFAYTINLYDITLIWVPEDPANVSMYEIRQGTDWDTASFILRTPSLSALIPPLPVGSTPFLIKTINAGGVYCTDPVQVDIVIPPIGIKSVAAQVIDNNVLLRWDPFTSAFAIDHYEVYKGANLIGTLGGTFFAIFETIAGTFTYSVAAIDAGGNASDLSPVVATVNQPPDFQLLIEEVPDLSTATLTNALFMDGKVLVPVKLDRTFQQHFDDNTWDQPQDQVAAGYEIFIQPDATTGEIETAEIDLGAEVTNVIVNLSWSVETFPNTDTVTIAPYIKGAPASHVYGAYQAGQSVFFQAVRYLRVKVDFSGDADSIINFYNLRIAVDVKREVDSNNMDCLASDTDGTIVYIDGLHNPADGHGRKVFKDIDSITLAAREVNKQPVTALLNFVDAPNPTSFKILCFDASGRRVDANVAWKARGIV